MKQAMPVACTLTDAELRERKNGLLAALGRHVVERRETGGGPVWFDLSGPAGTKEFLSDLLGVAR